MPFNRPNLSKLFTRKLNSVTVVRNLLLALGTFFGLTSCGQTSQPKAGNGFVIDPGIKSEVEKHIEPIKEFEVDGGPFPIYANPVFAEAYTNDTLSSGSNDARNKIVFKSFYFWRNDTLSIDGAYGLFGSVGFCIKYRNGAATLYHMLSSDDFPTLAYNEKDSLIFRLEVPCTDTKIVLSEIPDSTKRQVIYGYVAFKSKDYYSAGGDWDENEEPPRNKQRCNMKIYFKSGYFSF